MAAVAADFDGPCSSGAKDKMDRGSFRKERASVIFRKGEGMKGERISDGEVPTEPGQYSKHIVQYDREDEAVCWMMKSPAGGPGFLIGPKPPMSGHEVEENSDGTITVQPHPNNSNSILITWGKGSWHGYIYNGEWKEA